MFDISTLISYCAACIAIILAPGPAQALVFSVTLSDGRKAGVITVLGLNSSVIIHVLAAAVGISAILAASAEAFLIVKYLGAVYLIYIGIKSLISKSSSAQNNQTKNSKHKNSSEFFSKAFLTGILNPKVALFFLAFVPQFVNTGKGFVIFQFLVFGLILAGIDIIYESILTLIIGRLSSLLLRNKLFKSIRQKISCLVMIALGVKIALMKQN